MVPGKRAESPSRKVNSVSAATSSGGVGVPAPAARATVIGTSTRKVSSPDAM